MKVRVPGCPVISGRRTLQRRRIPRDAGHHRVHQVHRRRLRHAGTSSEQQHRF